VVSPKDAVELIGALPEGVINEHRFVEHFFYGAERSLRRTRSIIKKKYDDALFDIENGAMKVTIASVLNQAAISADIEAMEIASELCGVEYDGLGVILEDVVSEHAPVDPFHKHFSPGSYVKFTLTNNKTGYLLFIGGNEKDGYFFDCLSVVDDGKLTAKELDVAPRLYRQPVQGVFDPRKFQYVGSSELHKLPIVIRFKMSHGGWLTPEEIDKIANEYSFQTPLADADWLPLLKKVVDSGKKIYISDAVECAAHVSKNGKKVIWTDGEKIPADQPNQPMAFGSYASFENLNAALTGDVDELALMDKAM